jgi:hypothetical protein
MAEPLAGHVRDALGVATTTAFAQDATREELLRRVVERRPAVVYTATHGAAPQVAPRDQLLSTTGAIVCQDPHGPSTLAAADVPADEPFAEGGVVFQFACFGYGAPAESDFAHWMGGPRMNADRDFVAALPKRLLAHPRGPLAYVGHLDLACLHAFDDPDHPDLLEVWHPRLHPFRSFLDVAFAPQPIGRAMEAMNKRYDAGNAYLSSAWERQQHGTLPDTVDFKRKLVNAFVVRSDAQNYLLFGDPAVHVLMDDG